MGRKLLSLLVVSLLPFSIAKAQVTKPTLPQPTTCINASFSNTTSNNWSTVSLKLTNNCSTPVDFQNSTITFTNGSNLNTTFWGNFSPLSYPINNLAITSQPNGSNQFASSLSLEFDPSSWSNTKLPVGKSFTIIYGESKADYVSNSVNVYLSTTPPSTLGQINLNTQTAQPSDVTQSYELVNVVNSSSAITQVQLPWNGTQQLTQLAPGNYTIQPQNVTGSNNTYQGVANPSTVTVKANSAVTSSITYSPVSQLGSITFNVAAMPSQLSGYTLNPSVTLTNTNTQSSVVDTVAWNTSTSVNQLVNGANYSFSAPVINFNGYNCAGTFNPTSATSNAKTPPTVQLAYACTQVAQDKVALNVSGLPNTTSSVTATLTPTTGSAVTQNISTTSGSGSATVNLTDGMVYTLSSTTVPGYSVSYNPQPLTAKNNASAAITYAAQAAVSSRIIGYLPGWKTPPSPSAMATAGYTNVLVAFGVFSTSSPGQIVNAFDTVNASYISQLHSAGLKVSLSLGGASTSIANTSVNFHQVLSAASSSSVFVQAFVKSVESFVAQYGFDGIDFDIEQGFTGSGSFTSPTGDIAALAAIINQLHADNPNLLISLAPQSPNISANSGFDDTWGNYSSLIMQTYNALSWVGVQIYNTGCVYGINQVCYSTTASPDFSVAVAVDLLANWPAQTSSGQATGFQPYVSHLKPSQVVLGYPAPNNTGASDGSPVTPTADIKRAIQCLNTAVAGPNSCDTYVPPKTYPGVGGVFEWELTYDQANNFQFASALKNCVMNGVCN